MLTIIAAFVATVAAELIPIRSAGGCSGDVLYHVEYSLGECQHNYGCNDGCTFDAAACDGLTSDELYECTGQCARIGGSSWMIGTDLFYNVYTSEDCSNEPFFSVDVEGTVCFTLPGVACQGKGADISSLTGYNYNYSYVDDDDHARSASAAAITDCLF